MLSQEGKQLNPVENRFFATDYTIFLKLLQTLWILTDTERGIKGLEIHELDSIVS